MYTKAKRLEKLIEDLFGFTKVGKVSMNVVTVDIVKLLGQLLEEFYTSFADKELVYELISNVPAKTITADGNLLARLFDNLINNAINYTGEDKRIHVEARTFNGICRISVTDTGDGIEPEKLPYIWDRYYRTGDYHKRAVTGTGLGLSIVKGALILHNAPFGVSSTVGGGSTFWFELPLFCDQTSPR